MKLTKAVVRQFEQDQQEHGTRTALFNLLWLKAADDLRAIDVVKIKTVERSAVKRKA